MKNAKSLVAASLLLGGLFLTSCSSPNQTGCYYSQVEKEQKVEKTDSHQTFVVHLKDEVGE